MGESLYEAWADAQGWAGSWGDVETGTIALLYEDRMFVIALQRTVKGLIAGVVKEIEDIVYLVHKLCIRITPYAEQNDQLPIVDIRDISTEQLWCIG